MARRLENYSFGRISVNGDVHTKDLIVYDDGVIDNWRRIEGHSLIPTDLAVLGDRPCRTLVVGCGASERLSIPDGTLAWLEARGVTVIALSTFEACERYNALIETGETGVVAALHLTC